MSALGYDATTHIVWLVAAHAAGCPTELNGITLTVADLNATQDAELAAAQAQPSGGLLFDGTTVSAAPAPPPPPPPPNANQALIDKLNALTLTAGGEGDQIRQAVVAVLQAQPPVPAV